MEVSVGTEQIRISPLVRDGIKTAAFFMKYEKDPPKKTWLGNLLRGPKPINGEDERKLMHALSCIHPEWIEDPPSQEALQKLLRGISYLPPIGGKVPLVLSEVKIEIPGTKSYWHYTGIKLDEKEIQLAKTFGLDIGKNKEGEFVKFEGTPPKVLTRTETNEWLPVISPYLTAEEHVAELIRRRQRKELGNVFVHQLSIQGRLPDEFKYMAFALVLDSPYKSDWSEPMFSAPWGQIAPMIHDGGTTDTQLNPLWKVGGRTDFLQRVSLVRVFNLEDLENLPVREVGKLPKKTLDDANAEKLERARLVLETKAYQRLALTLHCKLGTVPPSMSRELREKMGKLWDDYCSSIERLAGEYEIKGVLKATWFTSKPQSEHNLSVYGPRYEGPWEPIRDELVKVEGIRFKHPELRTRVEGILRSFTQKIDQTIGLA